MADQRSNGPMTLIANLLTDESGGILVDGYMGESSSGPDRPAAEAQPASFAGGTDVLASPDVPPRASPLLEETRLSITEVGFQTFLDDLPGLLAQRRYLRKLVAYHGKDRIASAATQKELWKRCAREAPEVPVREIMVELVAPQPAGS